MEPRHGEVAKTRHYRARGPRGGICTRDARVEASALKAKDKLGSQDYKYTPNAHMHTHTYMVLIIVVGRLTLPPSRCPPRTSSGHILVWARGASRRHRWVAGGGLVAQGALSLSSCFLHPRAKRVAGRPFECFIRECSRILGWPR